MEMDEELKEDWEDMEEHKGEEKKLNELNWSRLDRPKTNVQRASQVVKNVHKPRKKASVNIVDENWNLVLNMMLGIRNAIKSIAHDSIHLAPSHFLMKNSFELVHVKSASKKKSGVFIFLT